VTRDRNWSSEDYSGQLGWTDVAHDFIWELNFAAALLWLRRLLLISSSELVADWNGAPADLEKYLLLKTDSLQTRAKSDIGIGPILVITLVVRTRLLKKSRIEKSGESEAVSNGQTKARILS
jgi:hypothetical protein